MSRLAASGPDTHSPEIIFTGEIRDTETMEGALSYVDNISDLRIKIKTQGLIKESNETGGPSLKLRTT